MVFKNFLKKLMLFEFLKKFRIFNELHKKTN
jgi:hypothetical protein